jgi:hypothetical protein
MGKNEKMNKGRIVELINRKAGTHPDKITDIEVLEEVSFVTVPSKDAKSILKFFRRTLKGKQPLVTKVKEEQKQWPKNKKKGRPKKEKGRFIRP